MEKLKIACLFGGNSSEYEVSLVSASAVIKNIDKEKYTCYLIGITREGEFYLYEGSVDQIENDKWFDPSLCKRITFSTNRSDQGFFILEENKMKLVKIDLAFPILHGKNGEDGTLQGLFELAGIKYVGCGMTSSCICMDKYLAHELVEKKGIKVAKSYLLNRKDEEKIEKFADEIGYPLFVKPLKAGSSYGITKVKEKKFLKTAIQEAFQYDDKVIIEETIAGFEVGCAILGNFDLTIGEVDEIELETDFFDYEEKYTLKTSKIHLPARISKEERERIQKTALKIYTILGCKGLARVDMFYTKEKEIVFNEVNTLPGFTSHSRYPNMLKEIGYSFKDLVEKLIELGLES